MPDAPEVLPPEFATSDAVYADPGKPWDGTVRKVAPGGLVASGYTPEDEPTAQELNYQLNAQGQWIKHLSDVQLCNWTSPLDYSASGASGFFRHAHWHDDDSLATKGCWVGVGSSTLVSNIWNPHWAGSNIATAKAWRFGFYSYNLTKSIILSGDDEVTTLTLPSTLANNIETASDELWTGVHDIDSNNDIVVGFLAGANLGFLYGTTAGVSDLNRSASTFAVPDLGGGASVARGNANAFNMHVASDGNGTLLCLVSYHGSASGRVDQFVSTDSGVTWTETQDVWSGVGTGTATGCRGLAWDAVRGIWVGVRGNPNDFFTAPLAGASSWTLVGTPGTAVGNAQWLVVVGGVWVTQKDSVTIDNGAITWSRDGGSTWVYFPTAVSGQILSYAPPRNQLLAGGGRSTTLWWSASLAMGSNPA